MLIHHIQNAWRAIRHKKLYTAINILGLSIGLCACMVIFLIARFDLGFDHFHPDADRIFRIVGDVQMPDGNTIFLNCPPEQAALEHGIPGFEHEVGFHTFGGNLTVPAMKGRAQQDFSTKAERYYGTSMILTGPSFFDIFPRKWLLGEPSVLSAPNQIVLSEKAARKYFGSLPLADIINKQVIISDSLPLTVAGIVNDWDQLSDLDYTGFISISTAPNSWVKKQFPTADWGSLHPHQSQAFVKLATGVSKDQINAGLANYIKTAHPKFFTGSSNMHLYLQSLKEMHYTPDFHPTDSGDDFPKAYLPTLYVLMGVAGFILLLAIINFINLSTAQSLQRMKEVGIRKVMGGSRKGLITQFVSETFVITCFAVVIALLLVRPAMWLFGDYVSEGVKFTFNTGAVIFLLAIITFTTLTAGLYPARVLSSYLPVLSLKGSLDKQGTGGAGLRKILIVFQFTISLFFIIGSLVIGRQIRYMHDADKGFSADAILTINAWRAAPEKMQLLAQGIGSIAGVKQVIHQGNAPMGWAHAGTSLIYKGEKLQTNQVMIQFGGHDLIPFYEMKLLAGKTLSQNDSARELVINETYSKTLGFTNPSDAVGKFLYQDSTALSVVGVIADFQQGSFHESIKPLVIWNAPKAESSIGIKLATLNKSSGDIKTTIAGIEKVWKDVFPKSPFSYAFLDESITQLYAQESNTVFLTESAMTITICISCLGLFGLALFTVRRREKEIGIRKVLGATVTNIGLLLSREFLLLVLLALVIASPVAWYVADKWLSDFAYRTTFNGWILLEAGAGAMTLALLTVGFLALRAARENPAVTLKRE